MGQAQEEQAGARKGSRAGNSRPSLLRNETSVVVGRGRARDGRRWMRCFIRPRPDDSDAGGLMVARQSTPAAASLDQAMRRRCKCASVRRRSSTPAVSRRRTWAWRACLYSRASSRALSVHSFTVPSTRPARVTRLVDRQRPHHAVVRRDGGAPAAPHVPERISPSARRDQPCGSPRTPATSRRRRGPPLHARLARRRRVPQRNVPPLARHAPVARNDAG